MEYRKIFFPIGGGEELRERIHGALLIAKYFNSHLEVFKAYIKPSNLLQVQDGITQNVLEELNKVEKDMFNEDFEMHLELVKEEAEKIGVSYSAIANSSFSSVELIEKNGYRSKLIKEESKYCDLVVVASPHNSKITATFESTITKSGKVAIMFPRIMKEFKTDNILIAWNGSTEVSRAVTQSMPLLKNAASVKIVYRSEFVKDIEHMEKLQSYLEVHGVKTTFEMIKPTMIPGESLLAYATENKIDLIVAGAFGKKTGFKSFLFGGTTNYILKHTVIPIFMSH